MLAVYGLECGGIPISGAVPEDADIHSGGLRATQLYEMGTNPDFAALAAEYGLHCNMSQAVPLHDSRQDDAATHVWAATQAVCPQISESRRLLEPEQVQDYSCPNDCVAFLMNLGACAETAIAQVRTTHCNACSSLYTALIVLSCAAVNVLGAQVGQHCTVVMVSLVSNGKSCE